MGDARGRTGLTLKQINKILGVSLNGGGMSSHYFGKCSLQWTLPVEEQYNILRTHMVLKPYEEIKQEYENLRRTFNLTADRQYNNTWIFKQTPSRKERHPCEKTRRTDKSYNRNQ